MASSARSEAMARGRRADSTRRRERVQKTLDKTHVPHNMRSPSQLARIAASSTATETCWARSILAVIEPAHIADGAAVINAALQTDLLNTQQQAARAASRELMTRINAATR